MIERDLPPRTVAGLLPESPSATPTSRSARALETVLRRVLDNPSRFSYGALAISVAITSLRGFHSARELTLFGLDVLAFALWLQFWVRQRHRDDTGRRPITIVLAYAGPLLLSGLCARDLLFTLVAVSLLPQFFTYLPLPVAATSYIPLFVGSEYSHTMAVLEHPGVFPWGSLVVRGMSVIAIGLCFMVVALQIAERARLQASLAQAERKAGVLEERQRLAREIHDTLAQGFASIIVHLERTEQINHLGGSPAKGHLDLARSVAREGLEESRRMLGALRPEILEQRALPEAVGRFCQEWSRRTGVESKLSITGAPEPMHPDIELTLLRAVQEGLANIARHAGARTTAVTLSYMEDVIVLDVQDDGQGFIPALPTDGRSGFGLAGMRERAESLQGSVQIESVPGEGTTLSMTLPMVRPVGGDAAVEVTAS
ncbi:MAG: sensor histidine kinase [Gemmatimonadales bacterium]